jgi:RecJ-like exonuclease
MRMKTCPVCDGCGSVEESIECYVRDRDRYPTDKTIRVTCGECDGTGELPVVCACGGEVPDDLEVQCESCWQAEEDAAATLHDLILPDVEPDLVAPNGEVIC